MNCDDRSQMIFAEVCYPQEYADIHAEMVAMIQGQFSHVEFGLQSDSWIWIIEADDKVAIDTFSSMKHQVKSYNPVHSCRESLIALRAKYDLQIFDPPVEEGG